MTTKQAIAIKNITQGDSAYKAMIKAGYAKNTAKNPALNLTRRIPFNEIMEKHGITDDKLAEKLDEGLGATNKGDPDYSVRHKYVETSLRLKGHDKETPKPTIIIPIYGGLSARPTDVRDTTEIPLSGYDSDPQYISATGAN